MKHEAIFVTTLHAMFCSLAVGLCRTCEIFGVSEIVLQNVRLVEEKQFQSLSVSAEKWIRVTEVRTYVRTITEDVVSVSTMLVTEPKFEGGGGRRGRRGGRVGEGKIGGGKEEWEH